MPPVTTSDSQEQSSSSMLKERRFKLSRACDRCRRRRIKCDEGHPCQACLTASSACTFEEPGKRTHPHKSKRTATLEDRMHHLETLIQAIPPAVFAAGGAPMSPTFHPSNDSSSSPISAFMPPAHSYPSGVPPPSLHVFPLMNPSTHFSQESKHGERQQSPNTAFRSLLGSSSSNSDADRLAEETSRMSISASYLYIDDEGYTRWQGETSGLPLLDLIVERYSMPTNHDAVKSSPQPENSWSGRNRGASVTNTDWFPDRTPRRTDINPETLWRLITSYIVPELMDSLVQCYLSTSYYILPFLHVPSFLADYGNPQKWGEPGFGAFIVSICCLASRHIDDPRVRADPNDSISAGTQWFDLLGRLRTLPISDRPTLYTIQADLIAAVYAVGLGRLSKAAALLSEAITVCVDAGLHRSADSYDLFDPIEDEVRKRTFWCVYIWDKQLAAHFGRPPMIRLKNCDVGEPAPVDDEFITHEGLGVPPPGTTSRMSAFVCSLRILVVLESVVDVPPARPFDDSSPFLLRAASILSGSNRRKELREEEALLDDIHRSIPPYWSLTPETLASDDTIRLTQASRLHCAENFVKMLIYRHRFTDLVAERTGGGMDEEQGESERESMTAAHSCAMEIISTHLNVATKGLMTYYGVHVIHQLTQAGRTLIAILLNCKSEVLQHLIPPALEALRSCVGLLRRFSGRYVCGQRSRDLLEEFCRLTRIPLESMPEPGNGTNNSSSRPPWIRPIRKKTPSVARSTQSADSPSQHSSPESFSPVEFFADMATPGTTPSYAVGSPTTHPLQPRRPTGLDGSANGMEIMRGEPQIYMSPGEVMAMFNDGAVDVAALFAGEFSHQPHGDGPAYLRPSGLTQSP